MPPEAAAPAAETAPAAATTAAPAAAPAKGTAPAPSPAKTVEAPFNDAFAALDTFGDEPNAQPGGKRPSGKAPGATKPGEKPSETTPASEKKEATEAQLLQPKPGETPKPVKAADLRAAKDAAEARARDLEVKVKDLEARAAKPVKPDELPEVKTLQDRLTAAEKRVQEYEEKIRFSNYEQSEEFKQKYEEPFLAAYKAGVQRVSALKTAERKNEDPDSPDFGKVTPGRQGTTEDFQNIMRITDDDAAAQTAADLFGAKAPMVLFHRERVHELLAARNKAIDDFRTQGSERDKKLSEQAQVHQKELSQLWESENKSAVERFPQWFKPEDGDENGNAMLDAGYHLADRAFSDGRPLRDGDKPLSGQEMLKLHSAIRNKAGAFDRLAFKHHQLTEKVKTLETELAEFKKSEPGGGDGKGRKAPEGESTNPDEIFNAHFLKK